MEVASAEAAIVETAGAITARQTAKQLVVKRSDKLYKVAQDTLLPNPLDGTIYRKKVLDQIATKDFHGFPLEVDNYAKFGYRTIIQGGDGLKRQKIILPGSYKNRDGHFEWIIEANNEINHRIFKQHKAVK